MELYITLTTIFQRQRQCARTLESIFSQSVQPKKIYLFLSDKPHLLDKGIRQFCTDPSLTELQMKHPNLIIEWVENQGPYRKLLPLLKKVWQKDVLLLTIDDDVVYKKDFVKTALDLWNEHRCCIGFEGTRMNSSFEYQSFQDAKGTKDLWNLPKGVGGILYTASWFSNQAIFQWKDYPSTDDLWFTAWRIAAKQPCYIHTETSIERSLAVVNNESLWNKFNASKNSELLEQIFHGFVYKKYLVGKEDFFPEVSQTLFRWNSFVLNYLPFLPPEPLEGSLWNKHLSSEPEITLLGKQKNFVSLAKDLSGGLVCEIGFNAGFSAALWLLANPSLRLHCFDLGEHSYTRPAFDILQNQFGDRIQLQLGDSQVTMKMLVPGYDLVHVDGGHTEAIAKSDCQQALRILKPGGLLLLDDTNLGAVLKGIEPFLDKFIEIPLPFSSSSYKHTLYRKR